MSLVFDSVDYLYPGARQGVHGISMQVDTGELLAVIGPSGSGKSTLLKLVAGLETGHAGSILLNGQDLAGTPVHRRGIGMVFQSYALFPHLSVADNVAYGMALRKVDAAQRQRRARELLELVGLAEHAARAVTQLSGASSSVSRWRARWPSIPAPCCWTSRSRPGRQCARLSARPDSRLAAAFRRHHAAGHPRPGRGAGHGRPGGGAQDGRLLQIAAPHVLYERPACRAVAEFVGLSTLLPGRVAAPDRVDVGFARLATATGARAPGRAVHVLVRPEHVEADPPPGAPNRLEGRVGAVRYLGAVTRYDFEVPGASAPFLAQGSLPVAGAIAIDPARICLLDD